MKIKKAIAIIAPVIVVVSAAFFLPPLLWENHIDEISGKAESMPYSMDLSKKGLTKEEFAEMYVNSGTGNSFIGSMDKVEALDSAKNIIRDFVRNSSPETEKHIEDLLSVANLTGFDERYQLINTDSASRAVDIVSTELESYCNGGMCYIGLEYEKKTGVIIRLDIQILEDGGYAIYYGDARDRYASDGNVWLESMIYAAEKYYTDLGLREGMFAAWLDYSDGIIFHMELSEEYGHYEDEKMW